MEITPNILAYRLSRLARGAILRSRGHAPIRGVRLASGDAPFDPALVYVGRAADFPAAEAQWPSHALLVAPAADLTAALNATLAVFEEYRAWDDRLNAALAGEGGLQDLIDASFPVFGGNPIYIVDTAFTTLAWSRQVPPDALDAGWASLAGAGHADPREINLLRESGALTRIHAFASASFFNYPAFRYPAIIAHARLRGERVASFVALEVAEKLTPAHLDLADHFARAATRLLKRDAAAGRAPVAPQASFLLDQLMGESYNPAVRDYHLALLGWRQFDRYQVARVRPASSKGSDDALVLRLNANLLQDRVPRSRSFVYEDSVIIVAPVGTQDGGAPGFGDKLGDFLRQSDLAAGLSCVLDDFAALPHGFRQATAALDSGPAEAPGERLFPYERVAARHLIQSAAAAVDWRDLCHPAARRLAALDARHHTEHVKTLLTYLALDRSLTQSAHALRIHRNTLLYRLDRIKALLGVDLEDEHIRLHLLLSCQMLQQTNEAATNYAN